MSTTIPNQPKSPVVALTLPLYTRYLAKSDRTGVVPESNMVTVHKHCLAVGHAAREIIRLLPGHLRSWIPDWYPFVAACHDVGKLSQFQDYIRGLSGSMEQYHELWSARTLADHMGMSGTHSVNEWYDLAPLYVILKHHGGSREKFVDGGISYFNYLGVADEWDGKRKDLMGLLEVEFPYKDSLAVSLTTYQKEFMAGMLCVSDWVGSDERSFPLNEWLWGSVPSMARRAVLGYSLLPDVSRSLSGLDFKAFWGFVPNDMQSKMLGIMSDLGGRPAVIVVENGMGSGKTEAAVAPALECSRGFYFGLPTQVTSNRIYERIVGRLELVGFDEAVTLNHSKSSLYMRSRTGSGAMDSSWYSGRKKSILAAIGIGTADQALLAAVPVRKHHHVRVFGLAGKVLVLDEVHSYDAYTSAVIRKQIEKHLALGGQVIILSATLTVGAREALLGVRELTDDSAPRASYPCISVREQGSSAYKVHAVQEYTGVGLHGVPVSVRVARVPVGLDRREVVPYEELKDAIARVRRGELVLWVENTVRMSQEVYKAARLVMGPGADDVGLLHSAFTVNDRQSLESKWLDIFGKHGARTKGCLLVSTQVCEQSVDIDADYLVTRLCPLDMLMQRMGRLWRHIRGTRPVSAPSVCILSPVLSPDYSEDLKAARGVLGGSGWVYHPYALLRTISVVASSRGIFNLPGDIRKLMEEAYLPGVFQDDFLHSEMVKSSGADKAFIDSHRPGSLIPDDDTTARPLVGTRSDGVRSTTVVLVKDGTPLDGGMLVGDPLALESSSIRVTDANGKIGALSRPLSGLHKDLPDWQKYIEVDDDLYLLDQGGQRTGIRYDRLIGLTK